MHISEWDNISVREILGFLLYNLWILFDHNKSGKTIVGYIVQWIFSY